MGEREREIASAPDTRMTNLSEDEQSRNVFGEFVVISKTLGQFSFDSKKRIITS
jgi:hypothetical protein